MNFYLFFMRLMSIFFIIVFLRRVFYSLFTDKSSSRCFLKKMKTHPISSGIFCKNLKWNRARYELFINLVLISKNLLLWKIFIIPAFCYAFIKLYHFHGLLKLHLIYNRISGGTKVRQGQWLPQRFFEKFYILIQDSIN